MKEQEQVHSVFHTERYFYKALQGIYIKLEQINSRHGFPKKQCKESQANNYFLFIFAPGSHAEVTVLKVQISLKKLDDSCHPLKDPPNLTKLKEKFTFAGKKKCALIYFKKKS